LRAKEEIIEAYQAAKRLPIAHFGVVTSGMALKNNDINVICEAIRSTTDSDVVWCASLGCLGENQLKALKAAGLKRFHHNLETAESFFPSICSTHTYAHRLATVRAAKEVGMEICCGGILGMGESLEQRVELSLALARERVNSIPLNFLIPIKGTALEKQKPMKPLDIIRCIAMFRMMNPRAEIRVCAGRLQLSDLQSMIFFAGATGMMIGPLLTVAGRNVEEDLQMLEDLEAR
jgi:biotin synthase